MKVGHVPLIPYHRPGAPEAAERVAADHRSAGARGTPIRAVMLERLGPNVWHDTPAAAMAALEELEETARLWLLRATPATPRRSTNGQIDELRRTLRRALVDTTSRRGHTHAPLRRQPDR